MKKSTKASQKPMESSQLTLVLQWLSYSLWLATLLVVTVIVSSVLSYFLVETYDGNWVTYFGAALAILFPAAYAVDRQFKKSEPETKTGLSLVVLVSHAVITGITVVGALIVAAIALANSVVGTSSGPATATTIIASLTTATLAAVYLARIVKTKNTQVIHARFIPIVTVVVVLGIAGAIAGPIAEGTRMKYDRLTTQAYQDITWAMSNFATNNRKLPDSLNELDIDLATKNAIEEGTITYTKKDDRVLPATDEFKIQENQELKYELCASWDYSKKQQYPSYGTSFDPYGGGHEPGTTCYQETAYVY